MNQKRVREIGEGRWGEGPVLYWISRDQRAADNWALVFAQRIARERRRALGAVFCLSPRFLDATWRQYAFMLDGLEELHGSLQRLGIPLFVLAGEAHSALPPFLDRVTAGAVVCDFSPLRVKQRWTRAVRERITIPLFEVDAHNIVPCWLASPKQEYAARTFRPRVTGALDEFLDDFPRMRTHPVAWSGEAPSHSFDALRRLPRVRRDIAPVSWIGAGERAAHARLRRFLDHALDAYGRCHNDPVADCQSHLSPYMHFGQIAPQRIALAVRARRGTDDGAAAFLEQLIVRRELSDNFCYYNQRYDTLEGAPDWARQSLRAHRRDRRDPRYDLDALEGAETHDALWNAAQRQMTRDGKMHGYMRMYWAKKLLEWTPDPAIALEYAITLNDRYELDGRDPNGYVGCIWSIAGLHDRPWKERPVFGKIRYMSYAGCASKFDVNAYIARFGDGA
jgi:deoxyribodipyrimidine photo-lyase